MTSTRLVVPYARIGWLATTIALAVALVVGAWANYQGARSAVATLNQGQAELLDRALRDAFHPWITTPDSAALRRFVEANPEFGVRFIALFDRDGRVAS